MQIYNAQTKSIQYRSMVKPALKGESYTSWSIHSHCKLLMRSQVILSVHDGYFQIELCEANCFTLVTIFHIEKGLISCIILDQIYHQPNMNTICVGETLQNWKDLHLPNFGLLISSDGRTLFNIEINSMTDTSIPAPTIIILLETDH